jgi:hypothetical protein
MSRAQVFKYFPVLIAAFLTSCSNATGNSNEVDQNNIFGDYSVIQNGNDDTVQMFTWFRYAGQTGTTLRLTDGSEIVANDQRLNLIEGSSQLLNFTGSYYTRSFSPSSLVSEYSIDWRRNDGKVFRNIIPAPKKIEAVLMVDEGSGGDTIVRAGQIAYISIANGGITATFEGAELEADERISCTLWSDVNDSSTQADRALIAKWDSTLKICVFEREALRPFQIGAAHLRMIRQWRQEDKAQGHERAGSATSSLYIARDIACEISP